MSMLNISEETILSFLGQMFSAKEYDRLAFKVANIYIGICEHSDGYEYSLYNMDLSLFDEGIYDDSSVSILEAASIILANEEHVLRSMQRHMILYRNQTLDLSKVITQVDYDGLVSESCREADNSTETAFHVYFIADLRK